MPRRNLPRMSHPQIYGMKLNSLLGAKATTPPDPRQGWQDFKLVALFNPQADFRNLHLPGHTKPDTDFPPSKANNPTMYEDANN
jgi:hypothetical protein